MEELTLELASVLVSLHTAQLLSTLEDKRAPTEGKLKCFRSCAELCTDIRLEGTCGPPNGGRSTRLPAPVVVVSGPTAARARLQI